MSESTGSAEEVLRLIEEVAKLKDDVMAGRIDPADAAVAIEAYQLIKDPIELDMHS